MVLKQRGGIQRRLIMSAAPAARSPIWRAACGAASPGKRWLVPLAVFLCIFGLILIFATASKRWRRSSTRSSERLNTARDLLACPACEAPLSAEWTLRRVRRAVRGTRRHSESSARRDPRTETVRQFYERGAVPGYPPRDSLQRVSGARRAQPHSRSCSIPRFPATRASSKSAAERVRCRSISRAPIASSSAPTCRALRWSSATAAARRYGIAAAQFVETDLHRPGVKLGVVRRGLLVRRAASHAANPAPRSHGLPRWPDPAASSSSGSTTRSHGFPHACAATIARLTGFRILPFDPVLRDRRDEPARREAWLRDQYQHPEEHRHTVSAVKRWFAENGVEYLRTFPSTVFEDEGDALFAPAADDWSVEAWLAQLGWLWTRRNDGGLFVMIGRQS